MVSLKRMISGGLAAVLALALSGGLYASPAVAQSSPTAEKPRPGSTQTPPRNPRDAKRPYAKRGAEAPRPPRMSPEERRQLRRDIKDAGREIYPPRR